MFKQLNGALAMMQSGPGDLTAALAASAAINRLPSTGVDELQAHLEASGAGDETVGVFRRALAGWDSETDVEWVGETPRNTAERRTLIYDALGLDESFRGLCESRFPFHRLDPPVVIAIDHERWYDETRRKSHSFYWDAYKRQLASQGWSEDAIAILGESTTSVVERISDPANPEAYQSKGLVVGYVQSGKTANFTGVIAKAADAGYRLIIVLAGTLDVLRSQTQRRVDKDMIGRELLDQDYVTDAEWPEFLSHGGKPSELGAFDWYRQTGPESDYIKLGRGFEALKFDRADPSKPFWDKDNLFQAGARIAVVKKHSKVLERLINDLRLLGRNRIGAPLDQIPVLVIDDESDQASINSVKPSDDSEEQERTATNKAIVDLLKLLPRAQYVGYTATPFANVFVDPSNEEDIFPKDFMVSLPRPKGYMGVADFYDLEGSADDEASRPNKKAFMRPLVGEDRLPANLPKALDAYVLTAALKLFRHERSGTKYRHHTMLAHASSRVADHETLAEDVRACLRKAGYDGGKGVDRLAKMLEQDFRPVSLDRAPDLAFPVDFAELAPFVGEALGLIGDADEAIRVLNNDNKHQTPDFDREPIWKILVGGTKLSRGYTVEGLTVSYYRRRAQTADSLMQMGRWFGFRRGYHDLVRLFIGTEEWLDKAGRKRIDLYEAFGAVCRDEEMFREELKRYANLDDPRVTPRQIPPLVPMHMLKPTAANKMYNARVTYRNFGGRLSESTYAPADAGAIEDNQDLLTKTLSGKKLRPVRLSAEIDGKVQVVPANVTEMSTAELLAYLKSYVWFDGRDKNRQPNPFLEQIEFLQGTGDRDPAVDDWIVIAPQVKSPQGKWNLNGVDLDVIHRTRNGSRLTTFNDPDHRRMGEHIVGIHKWNNPSEDLIELSKAKRGVVLLYVITDTKGARVKPPYTPGVTLIFPPNSIPKTLTFGVSRPDLPGAIVVPMS